MNLVLQYKLKKSMTMVKRKKERKERNMEELGLLGGKKSLLRG